MGTEMYVLLGGIVLVGVLIVLNTSKRKKLQGEMSGMLDNLRPGDRVKTVGGVIGRIKEIREEAPGFKTVLIESGSAKNPTTVLYDIQAIYGVINEEAVNAKIAEEAARELEEKKEPEVVIEEEPSDVDFDAKKYVSKRNNSAKGSKKYNKT